MANEYRANFDENGNVIDPFMWVENNNLLAGEFNGGLDRDNFGQADIAATEVNGFAFNTVHHLESATTFTPDITNTDWQGIPHNGASTTVPYTWTSTEDAHYDIHWSTGFSNQALVAYSYTESGTYATSESEMDTIEFRINIDGVIIATAGPFDDAPVSDSTYLVGSIVLPAGPHTLRIEAALLRRIAQKGQAAGKVTQNFDIGERCWVMIERRR